MINIQPITIPTRGIGNKIEIIFQTYTLGDTSGSFHWFICSDLEKPLISGELIIEGEEFSGWGTEDDYMTDLIIDKLGLTKVI